MNSILINGDNVRSVFNNSLKDWKPNEICLSFIPNRGTSELFTNEIMKEQMKIWRKLAKQGKIKIMEYNNKTKMVNDVEHYTLVVQPYKNDKMSDCDFDVMGLFCLGEMVSGYMYLFKNQKNRDTIYNYVMKNITQPKPSEDDFFESDEDNSE